MSMLSAYLEPLAGLIAVPARLVKVKVQVVAVQISMRLLKSALRIVSYDYVVGDVTTAVVTSLLIDPFTTSATLAIR